MRKFAIAALMLTGLTAAPKEVSFPSPDGGVVWGDLYGAGDRAVVLAHGARFNKASWEKQAEVLANAGFRVLAIDFRGYGKSHGGDRSSSGGGEKYQDILAAIRYLRENGAKTVSVIGASMGGGHRVDPRADRRSRSPCSAGSYAGGGARAAYRPEAIRDQQR